jgi:glutamate carboxypeptidase
VTPTPPVIGVLERLVNAVGGSYDVAEIETVNTILEDWLPGLGLRVERHPIAGHADLLVAEIATGSGDAPVTVTLVGHSDTVWPAGSEPGWRFEEDTAAGMLSGPGVGDMKASLVIAGMAAGQAADLASGSGLIRLVVVPDEEVGSVASRGLIERFADDSDLCIGLEAGKPGDGFVGSRGAVGAMRISATGRAVHVTEPGGINVLDVLMPLAAQVQALSSGHVLVSVCRFDAGTSRQIAAGSGFFEIDLRADRAEDLVATVDTIRAAADEAAAAFAGTVDVGGGMTRPALPIEASREPWRMLGAIDESLAHPAAHAVHERGGSDASFFAAAGVPTLDGFGAVCWDNCARGERIQMSSVHDRADRMARLIAAWIDAGKKRTP